jgi:uncharacterized protein YceH (UPF0502 family)
MAPFGDVSEVEAALQQLAAREDGPFVVRLAREPGRRESRYAQLFTGEVANTAGAEEERVAPQTPAATSEGAPATASRMDRLEQQVSTLRAELDALKQQLGL